MANAFPAWTRHASPEGRLILPDNEHSLAESFGPALSKFGDWLEDYADKHADKAKTDGQAGDKQGMGEDVSWSLDQDPGPDGGWTLTPDGGWNQNDLWGPHGGWNGDGKGPEPHVELLAGQETRRQQYAASNSILSLANVADTQQGKLAADVPAGAARFVERSLAAFDKLGDQTIADAPPAMKRYVTAQVGALRDQHIAQATRIEVAARNAWDKQTAQDMFDHGTALVTVDPDRFDFVVASLSHAIKARDLPADQHEALLDQVKDHLGYAAMTGIVDRDPDQAAWLIESGAADKYIAGGEKEEWLHKIADRQDQQRLDEVKVWKQADNAAPGLHLALRDTAKQDLLQQLQRGTLSQDGVNRWKDVLGPDLAADFTKMVGHRASTTSDLAAMGDLLMAAGDRDLWREATDAMLQGHVSTADFSQLIATNQRLMQGDSVGAAYRSARENLIQEVSRPSGVYATTTETVSRALWLFDGWVGAHPNASFQDLVDQAKQIAQLARGEQPVPPFAEPVATPGHRVFPADFVGPILPQDSFSLIPTHPPGADVDANMKEAASFSNPFAFRDAVKNKGRWDYKQQGKQYAHFGNFNYGATGHARGFSDDVLLKMAGEAQIAAGTSTLEWQPGGGTQPPYGDDPEDQVGIQRGIDYAKSRKKVGKGGK
jgi:hypothetical protein